MTTFAVHKPSATTSLRWEQSLWVATYLWVLCKVLQEGRTLFNSGLLIVWTLFILGGWALLQHSSDDAANFKSPLSAEKSSPAQSSSDPFDSETLSSPTTQKLKSSLSETVATSNKVGLYGSDKSSLRPSADDGSLCGLLMLPMVALAKVQDVALRESDDFHTARVHAKLELIMLTGTIFIILLLINRYLQPFRRTFRKRGLLLLTIVVSTFFTYLTTRLLAVTPALSNIPAIMTILTIVSFQWSLYICAVALKKCFTLGEMCILSQAASIVVYGSLEYIAISMFPNDLPDFLLAQEINNESVLSYAVVLGMAFIGIAVYPLLRQSRRLAQKPYWRMSPSSYTASDIHKRRVTIAIAVYTLTAIIVFFGIGPLCHRIMRENPFLWVLSFVFLSLSRLSLCVYWAMAVAVTVVVWVLVLDFTSSNAQQSSMFSNDVESKTLTSTLNKKRKLFHGLAVAMFVPGVLFEVSFMRLAFAVALSAFMFLEYLRYFAIWPYGKNIHMFLTEFIDNRDLGPVILSHIYLLLGCAGPVWLEGSNLLATMSGIISLGFGDTAASLAGKKFGRHRWPGSKKSIEGTVAFIMAVYISSLLVLYSSALLGVTGSKGFLASIGKTEWLLFFVTSILIALLEAFSLQNDNIIVPLYMFTLVTMTFRA